MAVLGLRFCARVFSSCGERGPLFIAVRGPLTIVASRCGAQARIQILSSRLDFSLHHGSAFLSAAFTLMFYKTLIINLHNETLSVLGMLFRLTQRRF